MSNRKNEIINMYFVKKMKPVCIAKKLNISKSAVTQVLQKDERYVKTKKDRIIQNQKQHKEKTKKYIKNVRKITQFKNSAEDLILKNMHNQASAELSQHKTMSNIAFRNWNKSAYSYNERKRRYEFKEELGRSYGAPKYIKVEVL